MTDSVWITQLRKGFAEYIVLLALKRGEAYGYEILEQLSRMQTLALGESTVYPMLSRLTQSGFLSARTVNSSSGPPRRYYRLTAAGKERLQEMDAYWGRLAQSIEQARKGALS